MKLSTRSSTEVQDRDVTLLSIKVATNSLDKLEKIDLETIHAIYRLNEAIERVMKLYNRR